MFAYIIANYVAIDLKWTINKIWPLSVIDNYQVIGFDEFIVQKAQPAK